MRDQRPLLGAVGQAQVVQVASRLALWVEKDPYLQAEWASLAWWAPSFAMGPSFWLLLFIWPGWTQVTCPCQETWLKCVIHCWVVCHDAKELLDNVTCILKDQVMTGIKTGYPPQLVWDGDLIVPAGV